eukprot:172375-Amphidinium_carterae.1
MVSFSLLFRQALIPALALSNASPNAAANVAKVAGAHCPAQSHRKSVTYVVVSEFNEQLRYVVT